jgi:dTDP-4-dehydrorhamnose reductase
MLAGDLGPILKASGLEAIWPNRSQLDIQQEGHLSAILATFRPDIVINCAAFTKVDLSESDPRAEEINDRAVGILAAACERRHAKLVQLSTDFVFDGTKRHPYVEEDTTNPISAYGRTKLGGERRALDSPGALVVRASWLFGNRGSNFVEAILAQVEGGSKLLRVVTDQVGRPTATMDLAEAIVALLDVRASGIVHFANAGEVSWNEFAREIVRRVGGPEVEVAAITSSETNRPAKRPGYSVLSTARYEALTGRSPRDFREPLAEYLARRQQSRRMTTS